MTANGVLCSVSKTDQYIQIIANKHSAVSIDEVGQMPCFSAQVDKNQRHTVGP